MDLPRQAEPKKPPQPGECKRGMFTVIPILQEGHPLDFHRRSDRDG